MEDLHQELISEARSEFDAALSGLNFSACRRIIPRVVALEATGLSASLKSTLESRERIVARKRLLKRLAFASASALLTAACYLLFAWSYNRDIVEAAALLLEEGSWMEVSRLSDGLIPGPGEGIFDELIRLAGPMERLHGLETEGLLELERLFSGGELLQKLPNCHAAVKSEVKRRLKELMPEILWINTEGKTFVPSGHPVQHLYVDGEELPALEDGFFDAGRISKSGIKKVELVDPAGFWVKAGLEVRADKTAPTALSSELRVIDGGSGRLELAVEASERIGGIDDLRVDGGEPLETKRKDDIAQISLILGEVPPGRAKVTLSWSFRVLDLAGNASPAVEGSGKVESPRLHQAREALRSKDWGKAIDLLNDDMQVIDADSAITALWQEAEEAKPIEVTGFKYLRDESFSCGGQTHSVNIYIHEKTGLEFVLVPGGEFVMGSPEGEPGRDDDEKQHTVTVKSFLICRTEVTQKAWDKVGGDDARNRRGEDLPIAGVSWNDCTAWCRKAGLRLPSEAEWEYVCRAGTTGRFCFGDSDSGLGAYAWYKENSVDKVHPVGQKKPNAFGLLDMHGNVWEWCQDWYTDNYDKTPHNGTAYVGRGMIHALGGGSWRYHAHYCRSACRFGSGSDFHSDDLGFRPASSLF